MTLKIFQVDAFTSQLFRGNPAAICLVPYNISSQISDETLLNIAKENNLSETAFVIELNDNIESGFEKSNRFRLRWFTPTVEVKLCGHATLATGAILFQKCNNKSEIITFETLSGDLHVWKEKDNKIGMNFPLNNPLNEEETKNYLKNINLELVLKAVLGEKVDNEIKEKKIVYSPQTKKLIVHLHPNKEKQEWNDQLASDLLKSVSPDITKMMLLHDGSIFTGVSVTVVGGKNNNNNNNNNYYHFQSRYFAPWNGINEDPVNGSSHTILAPYWSMLIYGNEWNKMEEIKLNSFQCSQRSGELFLTVQPKQNKVIIAGHTVLVLAGEIYV